jgi:GH35 family endo-1,4-beta-xylanase
MISFAEKHNMKSKVNTFMFYADFPKILEDVWLKQASSQGLDDTEKHQFVKEKMKNSLMGYVSHLAQNYGDRIENVDIFNELIYDPNMIEKREIFEEKHSYHPRTEGWQKYLDLEDLCEMALTARKLMPETIFTYNDMNWDNSRKKRGNYKYS